jgi:hypothetical protein
MLDDDEPDARWPILDTFPNGTQVFSQFAADYEKQRAVLAYYKAHEAQRGAWYVSHYADGSLHCVPTSGFINTTERRLQAMKAGMH